MSSETEPAKDASPVVPSVVIIMGVSGCGKSTIGALLASHLRWEFEDADWFHPASNVEKMHSGVPLTDKDRWPWLDAVANWIDKTRRSGRHGVVACSALKRSYRDVLIGDRADVRLIYLKGDESLIARRLATREHFMPPSLLHSQFEALEEPGPDENPIIVSIEPPPREIAVRILSAMNMVHRAPPEPLSPAAVGSRLNNPAKIPPPAALSSDLLEKMDAYWRAANYLTVGQIYLQDNPLLETPLKLEHIKPRLLGHWGTTTGLNFIYVHLNRLIKERDVDMIYIIGPGHGGPGLVAHSYLEGSYTERYPDIERSRNGMLRLFRQFSWPYGIPSHVAPETPGSIHEGGELGYSLVHAYGAAFDNPDLIVACIIGDGEAETGALATSWHSNKFLNPARDGAVLPILHLNGFKIANPTVLARISRQELIDLMRGYGYEPHFVEGDVPAVVHQSLAATLDRVLDDILRIQNAARSSPTTVERPRWPMIVFRTPKGWTGPKFVDGKPVEGTWRAHQVPIADFKNPDHLRQLEDWMRSYRPHKLFDESGKFRDELAALAPTGHRRMGMNPHANGGELLAPLAIPQIDEYAVRISAPGSVEAESTRVLGLFLRDVMNLNLSNRNFRVFGPDETASNRLDAVYQASGKEWMARVEDVDIDLSIDGRVMEVLSEHLCEGWLEGYLLTGRHGFFSCYEAFAHIIDSMFNQHAKWLKATKTIPWRAPIASLNYLLTSHVWRQDHNGFSHQDPGFIDHVASKKADVVRIYLPPDANCLLSVADHCLRSRNYVNLIVAGKQPEWQWLDMDSAVRHCTVGAGIWQWASNDADDPDVVMACAGDVPTLETLAAVTLLRDYVPDIRIRVVNVVDLMALQPPSQHPHGLEDRDFDAMFTHDKPVIFAFHGYPRMIHWLTYRRHNHDNFHVRGFRDEGTTTTPFDMVVLNNLDRYQLALDAISRIPRLQQQKQPAIDRYWSTMERHKLYVSEHGEDMPEVQHWRWTSPAA